MKKVLCFAIAPATFFTLALSNSGYLTNLKHLITNHPKTTLACATAAASTYAWYSYASNENPPLCWDWDALEKQGKLTAQAQWFPKNFLWGAGSSAQQVEGNCFNNSWAAWEEEKKLAKAGCACDQWNLKQFKNDVQLMKKIGLNAYRFSIEWSKLEPAESIFDEDGFEHYVQVCQELVDNGIRPIITLHHYTDPLWFFDKGGFEKEENINYYVRFCAEIFKALNRFKPLWLTFNSPASYALNSYYRAQRPPGKKSLQTAMEVLSNMLNAHVSAYCAMKSIDQNSEIGILHNIFHLELGSRFNPLDHIARSIGNRLTHTAIYDFFSTGIFKVRIPGMVNVLKPKNCSAQHALDFIGLNYYSHAYMRLFKPLPSADEIPTDNPQYTIYAEGLYRAIEELTNEINAPLKKITGKTIPIYVTENGIATTDDAKRTLFFKRTLYALSQACKAFKNVKGYIHWAFLDNYEWGTYEKKYGIYSVDFQTQQRTAKSGADHFKDVITMHSS